MFTRSIAVVASLLLLAGCAGDLRTDYQVDKERASSYVSSHPELDTETAAAIRANDLRKGMTMEQVVASWGGPAVVQRFRGGSVQYWFFGCNWRHICSTPDEMFPPPDAIYSSRALFEDGRLVDFSG